MHTLIRFVWLYQTKKNTNTNGCLMYFICVLPTSEDWGDGHNAEGQPLQVHLAGKSWHI